MCSMESDPTTFTSNATTYPSSGYALADVLLGRPATSQRSLTYPANWYQQTTSVGFLLKTITSHQQSDPEPGIALGSVHAHDRKVQQHLVFQPCYSGHDESRPKWTWVAIFGVPNTTTSRQGSDLHGNRLAMQRRSSVAGRASSITRIRPERNPCNLLQPANAQPPDIHLNQRQPDRGLCECLSCGQRRHIFRLRSALRRTSRTLR